MRYAIAVTLTAVFLGACNLTDTRTRVQQLGLLRLAETDSISFVAPDTVAINTDFSISTTTFGGTCDTKGPTDVLTLSNGTIDFRPFDITEVSPGKSCPLEIQTFLHTGTLRVSEAGPKTITLRGRDWNNAQTSRTKTVIVR